MVIKKKIKTALAVVFTLSLFVCLVVGSNKGSLSGSAFVVSVFFIGCYFCFKLAKYLMNCNDETISLKIVVPYAIAAGLCLGFVVSLEIMSNPTFGL